MRWDNYPGGGPVYKQNKTDTALLTYTVTQTCVIPDCDDPCVGGTRMIQLSCPWSQSKESLPRDPGWLRHCPSVPGPPQASQCRNLMNALQPGPVEAGGKTIFITRQREGSWGTTSLSSHLILHFIVNSMLSYMVRDRLCKANVLIW